MEQIKKKLTAWQQIHRELPIKVALQKRDEVCKVVEWSAATFYLYLNRGRYVKKIYKPHIAEVYGVAVSKIFPTKK